MDEGTCRTLLCFDLSAAAGFHAQLAGILAGLAFTAIVLILQSHSHSHSRSRSGRGTEAGLLSFLSALITLLIAAFLYGIAAGEELTAGRVTLLVFLAGTASAIAVFELFYGLTWLVRAGGFPNAAEMTARISALVVPLMTFLYLTISALNHLSVTEGRHMIGSFVAVFLSLLSLLLFLVLLLVQLAWASPELRRLAVGCAYRLGPEPWRSLVSVGGGLAAAVGGGILLQLAPTIAAPSWLVCAMMSLWFGIECVVVLLIRAIDIDSQASRTTELESLN